MRTQLALSWLLGALTCACLNATPHTTAFPLAGRESQAGPILDIGVRSSKPRSGVLPIDTTRGPLRPMFNVGGFARIGVGLQSEVGILATPVFATGDIKIAPLVAQDFAFALDPSLSWYWFEGVATVHVPVLAAARVRDGLLATGSLGLAQTVPFDDPHTGHVVGTMATLSAGAKWWPWAYGAMLLEVGLWFPVAGQTRDASTVILMPSLSFVFGKQPDRLASP